MSTKLRTIGWALLVFGLMFVSRSQIASAQCKQTACNEIQFVFACPMVGEYYWLETRTCDYCDPADVLSNNICVNSYGTANPGCGKKTGVTSAWKIDSCEACPCGGGSLYTQASAAKCTAAKVGKSFNVDIRVCLIAIGGS